LGVKEYVKTDGFKNASNYWSNYGFSPNLRHCFVEGSLVLMSDKTSKKIEINLVFKKKLKQRTINL